MKTIAWTKILSVAMTATLITGCTGMGPGQQRRSTNLSAFLYEKSAGPAESPSIPVLTLPLKVGMAFVPAGGSTNAASVYASAGPNYASAGACYPNGQLNALCASERLVTESEKLDLMKQISGQLAQYPSIKSADRIPSEYLVPGGGFANLDRIKALYGMDVIILLSYDQAQFTDEGALTLSYWTIVGAYVVPGEKTDTRTVLEAAVYDIASRKQLFRASGVAEIKNSATPVNLSERLRLDSVACLQTAATNLVGNLNVQLEEFRKEISATPAVYKIERKPGYTGGPFGEKG